MISVIERHDLDVLSNIQANLCQGKAGISLICELINLSYDICHVN